MTDPGLAERVERIEAQLAIQQLPIRYAMAVDARDIDAWVNCFRPDVNMGRHGIGRDVLRRYIEPQVRRFYRSVHQICGHRIELVSPDWATGAVYCRAEHEVGDQWIVMAICYFDEYAQGGRRVVLLPAAGAPLVRGGRYPDPAVGGLRRLGRQQRAGAAGRVRLVGAVLGWR